MRSQKLRSAAAVTPRLRQQPVRHLRGGCFEEDRAETYLSDDFIGTDADRSPGSVGLRFPPLRPRSDPGERLGFCVDAARVPHLDVGVVESPLHGGRVFPRPRTEKEVRLDREGRLRPVSQAASPQERVHQRRHRRTLVAATRLPEMPAAAAPAGPRERHLPVAATAT